MKRLAQRLEAAIRAVAPELEGVPIYVVFKAGSHVAGASAPWLDLAIRPDLPAGRWRGRGVGIVLNPGAVAMEAGRSRSARRRLFWREVAAVALHELSHAIVDGLPGDDDPMPGFDVDAARLAVSQRFAGSTPPTNGPNAVQPWRHHEADFIRTCIHLAHRCTNVEGCEHITARTIFDAADYGLSSTGAYAEALGDEPERLAHLSIFDIQKTTMPSDFTDLWKSDVRRWTNGFAESIREQQERERRIMLDSVFQKLRKRRESIAETYRDIVAALAAGQAPDVEAIERCLTDAGKSETDLQADVDRELGKRELQRKARTIGNLTKELGECDAKLAALAEKLERAQRAHDDAAGPLQSRVRMLVSELTEAEQARSKLGVEFSSDAVREARSDLDAKRSRAYELRRQIPEREAKAVEASREGTYGSTYNPENAKQLALRLQSEAEAMKQELAELERAIPEAEARVSAAVDSLAS